MAPISMSVLVSGSLSGLRRGQGEPGQPKIQDLHHPFIVSHRLPGFTSRWYVYWCPCRWASPLLRL